MKKPGSKLSGKGSEENDQQNDQPITDLLAALPQKLPEKTFRLHELLTALGSRSMSSTLLLLAIPQVLPTPLFLANALGLLLLALTVQMAMGRSAPWLPSWLLDKSFRHERLEMVCQRVVPVLRYVERFVRPRLAGVWAKNTSLIALACVAIAMVSVVPLPFTGWVPGWALLLIALGLLQRDGLLVLIGLGLGAIAIGLLVVVLMGLFTIGDAVAGGSAGLA